uniref:Uncharacterized protein n=1 Tax=Rattus norvegicus TaxID=10116 RepID=A0ABK0M4U7_RAT
MPNKDAEKEPGLLPWYKNKSEYVVLGNAKNTQDFLNQLLCKHGLLGFEDITATNNTNEIQDSLRKLTGVRTVPWAFTCRERLNRQTRDLISLQQHEEMMMWLKQIGALQVTSMVSSEKDSSLKSMYLQMPEKKNIKNRS